MSTILADLGIRVRGHHPGEHRAACPECARTKARPHDGALAIRLDPDGSATWCCHRCGWAGQSRDRDSVPPSRPRRPRPAPRPATPDHRDESRAELARELWRQAHPLCACEICGPGRAYMTSRGFSAWPEAVHFHSACPSRDFGTGPAILAPVNDAGTGLVTAVWRIRIAGSGEKLGRVGLGPARGNASRLFDADDELGLAEGVEDALALAELSGLPTWAALSAGNLRALILPTRIRRIVISADSDPVGLNAAQALARRLLAEGRSARIVRAIAHKDANDVLRARRAS